MFYFNLKEPRRNSWWQRSNSLGDTSILGPSSLLAFPPDSPRMTRTSRGPSRDGTPPSLRRPSNEGSPQSAPPLQDELSAFLKQAGLSEEVLRRVHSDLTAEDITSVSILRLSWSSVSGKLKVGPRSAIEASLFPAPSSFEGTIHSRLNTGSLPGESFTRATHVPVLDAADDDGAKGATEKGATDTDSAMLPRVYAMMTELLAAQQSPQRGRANSKWLRVQSACSKELESGTDKELERVDGKLSPESTSELLVTPEIASSVSGDVNEEPDKWKLGVSSAAVTAITAVTAVDDRPSFRRRAPRPQRTSHAGGLDSRRGLVAATLMDAYKMDVYEWRVKGYAHHSFSVKV